MEHGGADHVSAVKIIARADMRLHLAYCLDWAGSPTNSAHPEHNLPSIPIPNGEEL